MTNSFEDVPQVCAPTQIATQRKRLRSGKEEQGGRADDAFLCVSIKKRRSKADFAPAW